MVPWCGILLYLCACLCFTGVAGGFWDSSTLEVALALRQEGVVHYLSEGAGDSDVDYMVSQFVRLPDHDACIDTPDIMLSTHCDAGRLDMVRGLLASWRGCASVAVLVTSAPQLHAVLRQVEAAPEISQWAAVHMVLDLGGGVGAAGERHPYPFNVMRNAAARWPAKGNFSVDASHTGPGGDLLDDAIDVQPWTGSVAGAAGLARWCLARTAPSCSGCFLSLHTCSSWT